MPYKFKEQARKPLRLQAYDYSSPGYYFVTLCTEGRLCLFGDIINGVMHLNAAGCMIHEIWKNLPNHFASIAIDTFIVMPNHIHAIVVLLDTGPASIPAPTVSLPEIIRNIKSYTTHRYSQGVHEQGYLAFPKRLWQRSYYDHVIRNEGSLNQIRQYILDNPLQWEQDKNNPDYFKDALMQSPENARRLLDAMDEIESMIVKQAQ